MSRPLAIVLQIVRGLAVLVVLFGIGAAGSSFESNLVRGKDNGVFGNGILAILGLRDPPDGEMGPVWIGRFCVLFGIASFVAITIALNRAGTVVSGPKQTSTPSAPTQPTFSVPPRIAPRDPQAADRPSVPPRSTPLPPPPGSPSN